MWCPTIATSLVLLVVLAVPAPGVSRKRCRRDCRGAVHLCVTATGQGRAACKSQMLRRCKMQGRDVCLFASADRTCYVSAAPACGGGCALPGFTCVANPRDGCNCEAPACGPGPGGACAGVCADSMQVCVAVEGVCGCY
jgi:hypothetical protein